MVLNVPSMKSSLLLIAFCLYYMFVFTAPSAWITPPSLAHNLNMSQILNILENAPQISPPTGWVPLFVQLELTFPSQLPKAQPAFLFVILHNRPSTLAVHMGITSPQRQASGCVYKNREIQKACFREILTFKHK